MRLDVFFFFLTKQKVLRKTEALSRMHYQVEWTNEKHTRNLIHEINLFIQIKLLRKLMKKIEDRLGEGGDIVFGHLLHENVFPLNNFPCQNIK